MNQKHRCLVCHRSAAVGDDGIILPHEAGSQLCANSGQPRRTAKQLLEELWVHQKLLQEAQAFLSEAQKHALGTIKEALEDPSLSRENLQRFAAGLSGLHEDAVVRLLTAARAAVGMPPIWEEGEG